MKKQLLSIVLLLSGFISLSQTGICNNFSGTSGLSTYPDPSTEISYSVASDELTLTFTNASFWGNEVKWDFGSGNSIDISGLATPQVSYDVAIVSLTINGTGTSCASLNYVPLGISVYDTDGDYTAGTSSTGYYQTSYASGSNNITTGGANVNYAAIQGVSIKVASFTDANCVLSSVSGSIKLKNLKVGEGSCITPVLKAETVDAESKIFPNPSFGSSVISLSLKNSAQVKVVISDLMGKEIKTIAEGTYTELKEVVDTKEFKSGTYSVSYIIDGAFAKSELFIVR